MYIGKLKNNNNLIVIFEEKDIVINELEFLSMHKLSLNSVREIFERFPKGWIEAKTGYIVNADSELINLYNTLYPVKKEIPYKCKLVRFAQHTSDPYIRICSTGRNRKNYKNTVLLPNELILDFCRVAKKDKYTELKFSSNPKEYEKWSKYIDENEDKEIIF